MPVAVEAGVFKHIEILDISSSRGIPARPGGVRCRDPLRRLARIIPPAAGSHNQRRLRLS